MNQTNPAARKTPGAVPTRCWGRSKFRGETTLTIRPQTCRSAAPAARRPRPDSPPLIVTSVDWSQYPAARPRRFTTVYNLHPTTGRCQRRLKVPTPDGDSRLCPRDLPLAGAIGTSAKSSISWVCASTAIPTCAASSCRRPGHDHPLRKDIPRGGETVAFSTWEDEEFESFGQADHRGQGCAPSPAQAGRRQQAHDPEHGSAPPRHARRARVVVELDGERMVAPTRTSAICTPASRSRVETATRLYQPYTDRTDYVSSMSNNLGYSLAVERLMGVEIPPRAQVLRVIMAELQRVASHLLWLGTTVMDAAGMSHALLMYAFREREQLLDIFELVSGARLTTSYIRPGGIWRDVPPSFTERVQDVLRTFPAHFDEYERFMTENPVWKARTVGVGKLTADQRLALCVGVRSRAPRACPSTTGNCGRTAATKTSTSKWPPPPTATRTRAICAGSKKCARACASSARVSHNLPDGPVWTADRKMALPRARSSTPAWRRSSTTSSSTPKG